MVGMVYTSRTVNTLKHTTKAATTITAIIQPGRSGPESELEAGAGAGAGVDAGAGGGAVK